MRRDDVALEHHGPASKLGDDSARSHRQAHTDGGEDKAAAE